MRGSRTKIQNANANEVYVPLMLIRGTRLVSTTAVVHSTWKLEKPNVWSSNCGLSFFNNFRLVFFFQNYNCGAE